ncbi:hypothetical protein [Viridibacterium curvum]|uniref:hypothetical protein n=1 Tax=Viridibacterium curvum TaxID=1101404 RepID=UPI0031EB95B6
MTSTTLWVLLILGVAYAAFSIPMLRQFHLYCEKVAASTGREGESSSVLNRDDGGNNAFQLEQFRSLRTGEYKQLNDPVLVAQGSMLARKLRLSCWLAVGLVAAVGVTDLLTK